jgi:hypothetical protein
MAVSKYGELSSAYLNGIISYGMKRKSQIFNNLRKIRKKKMK